MQIASRVLRFGPNELDLDRYELRRGSRRLPLSRLPMEFLILLVEERGKLVLRDQIVARLWADPHSVDVVQGINNAVNRIRAVLNDDAAHPRFIETVVGKGYRFIAEVKEVEPATAVSSAAITSVSVPQAVESPGRVEEEPHLNWPPKQDRPVKSGRLVFWGVLLSGLLVAVLIWRHHSVARSQAGQSYTLTKVTTNDGENRVTAAAVSPDGRLLAFADLEGVSLRVIQTGATHLLRAPASVQADRIAWFSDDLRLLLSGFETATLKPQIWVISITGEAPRLLQDEARNGAPSPDGSRVAFTTSKDSEIWLEGPAGENPRRLITGQPHETFPFLLWAVNGKSLLYQRRRYAPDGKTSRFKQELEDNYRWDFESADVTSSKLLAATTNLRFDSACMLADGRLLYLRWGAAGDRSSYMLWEGRLKGSTSSFTTAARPVETFKDTKAFGLSASEDGTQIAAVLEKSESDVYVANLQPGPTLKDVRRLTIDTSSDYPHGWTPDSESVIFESDRDGRFQLYKQRLDQHRAEIISPAREQQVVPQLTSDGKWILYTTKSGFFPSPNDALFRVPVNGGNPVRVETGGPLDEFRCPLFGRTCVLRETLDHQEFVYYALDPLTGKGKELGRTGWLPGVLGDWDISPDGLTVALPYRDPTNRKIRLVPLGEGSARRPEREVAVDGFARLVGVNWAADGKGWYVSVQTETGRSLLYVDLQGSSRVLWESVGATWGVPSPDGRKLAFVNGTVDSNVWLLH